MGEERDLSMWLLLLSAAFLLFMGGMAVGHYQVFS